MEEIHIRELTQLFGLRAKINFEWNLKQWQKENKKIISQSDRNNTQTKTKPLTQTRPSSPTIKIKTSNFDLDIENILKTSQIGN